MELTYNPNLIWYLVIYGILMVVMGFVYSKKITTSEDFILAGRSLGPIVLMGTLIATWCGSGTVTGGGNSLAYSFGVWPGALFILPSIIGILIMSRIANKVRAYGKYTVSEILRDKYGPFAGVLSSIIIVLAFVGIVSYQFKGLGFILNVSTGIPIEMGTIIGALLIIFLASIGGLMAVAPTDALSAFLMLFGLVIVVPTVISTAGGWSTITANVPPSHNTISGSLSFVKILGYYLPVLVLMLADQNMYQRLASSKEDKSSRTAMIGWFVGLCIIVPAVAVIAFTARSIFPDIAPGMALISTTLVIPTFIGGILLASATAFIVTTGNSYLLSAATNITYDLYAKVFKPDATDKQKLMSTKVFVILLGVISYMLISYFPSVLSVQMYAYTVYGASLCPAVLAVFLWSKVTKSGGIASMLTGCVATLVWEIVLKRPMGWNSVIVALPLAIIMLVVVSLMTQDQNQVEASDQSQAI